MAFQFGGIKANAKPKDLRAGANKVDYIIADNFIEDSEIPYYLVLLDKEPKADQKASLMKMLQKSGIKSYMVLNAVDCMYNKDDLHGTGLTDFVCMHRSKWRNYITREGIHCEAVLVFGPALYSVNNGTDILPSDFYDNVWGRPYYYMGHTNYAYDCYFYPADSIDECWPNLTDKKSGMAISGVNFKTRFAESQLKDMVAGRHHDWKPITTERERIVCETMESFNQVLLDNMNAELVAFDTETNGFFFYKNKIHCLTISWDGIHGYFVKWENVNKRLLTQNLLSCKRRTGANPKFDLKFFWEHGVSKQVNVTDAIDRLSHCMFSDLKSGLKPLSFRYTDMGSYDLMLDKYKKQSKCDDYSKIPTDILSAYAIDDAIATWRVQKELDAQCDWIDIHFPNEKFKDWTIRRWYETQCMPIYRDIVEVEYKGIYVKTELMDKYRAEMQMDIVLKEDKLRKLWNLPNDFNLYSTTEIGRLFERMGWSCQGRNAKGDYITDDDAMQAWKREGHEGIAELIDLRTEKTSMNSFLGTYQEDGSVTGWLQFIAHNPENGTDTIKQSYKVMGTESFRFIGNDPNFQNIPTRSSYAKFVKKCITVPPADLYVITSDSGKEYRLAEFEYLLTERGYVQAKDMLETDTIVEGEGIKTVLRCSIDRQDDGSFDMPKEYWFRDGYEIGQGDVNI